MLTRSKSIHLNLLALAICCAFGAVVTRCNGQKAGGRAVSTRASEEKGNVIGTVVTFESSDGAQAIVSKYARIHEPRVSVKDKGLPTKDLDERINEALQGSRRSVSLDSSMKRDVTRPKSVRGGWENVPFWEILGDVAVQLGAGIGNWGSGSGQGVCWAEWTNEKVLLSWKTNPFGLIGIMRDRPANSSSGDSRASQGGKTVVQLVGTGGARYLIFLRDRRLVAVPGMIGARWKRSGKPISEWRQRPNWIVGLSCDPYLRDVPADANGIEISLPLEVSLEKTEISLPAKVGATVKKGDITAKIEAITPKKDGYIEVEYHCRWPIDLKGEDLARYSEIIAFAEKSQLEPEQFYLVHSAMFEVRLKSGMRRYRAIEVEGLAEGGRVLAFGDNSLVNHDYVVGKRSLKCAFGEFKSLSITLARTRSVRLNVDLDYPREGSGDN